LRRSEGGRTICHVVRGGVYAPYKIKDGQGIPLDSDAALKRYFEPRLAALIIKDRNKAAGELPTLDMDPFIDAQDWDISAVDIAVRDTGADKAKRDRLIQEPGQADHRGTRPRQAQGRVADRRHQLGPQANLARPVHQAIADRRHCASIAVLHGRTANALL
jgi:hypothetical protein